MNLLIQTAKTEPSTESWLGNPEGDRCMSLPKLRWLYTVLSFSLAQGAGILQDEPNRQCPPSPGRSGWCKEAQRDGLQACRGHRQNYPGTGTYSCLGRPALRGWVDLFNPELCRFNVSLSRYIRGGDLHRTVPRNHIRRWARTYHQIEQSRCRYSKEICNDLPQQCRC